MRLSRFATAVSALALAASGVFAAPASAAPAADPCGFFERGADALYNHCPFDFNLVEVYIDNHDGSETQTCVATGTTRIGAASVVEWAWSTRRACRV